jgi:hypothetical protein
MWEHSDLWTTTKLFTAGVVSLGALWFATHIFHTNAESPNLGWAIIPGVAACAAVIGRKRRAGLKTSMEWLFLLLPAAACLLIAVMIRSTLQELLYSPSSNALAKFEYSLYAFMLVFMGWIVTYPFDQMFIPVHPRTPRFVWMASFAVGGLLLCWYIGDVTVDLANDTLHPVVTYQLQLWMQDATFLLSAFVVARVLLRVTARQVVNTMRPNIGNA